MTTCTIAPAQQDEVSVATNNQALPGIVDPTILFVADQEANPGIGQAPATKPAELPQTSTPRYTLSITLGRAKPSLADYKSSMLNDTSFSPRTIALSQLKDVVKSHNYTFWHYKNNYRNGNNFSFSTGIILDFDGDSGMSVEEAVRKLGPGEGSAAAGPQPQGSTQAGR